MEFSRFPRTPHLAWLGEGRPRDDKVLTAAEADELLSHELVVEEKVDGANVGLSLDQRGSVRVQKRGAYLTSERKHAQFGPIFDWIAARRDRLAEALSAHLILFGEWCYATHSAHYAELPDWFLAFDVYDRAGRKFWSTAQRDELVRHLGLELVPRLAAGRLDLAGVVRLLGDSRLGRIPAEGLYVRVDEGNRLLARAKLVRPSFAQSIHEHWSRRALARNSLAGRRVD